MIKTLLTRLIPKYTRRRLAARLAVTLFTQPHRFFHRFNRENLLLYKQFSKVRARCCICGHSGSLFFDMPDRKLRRDHGIGILRETLLCKSCGSSNRQRTLAHVLIRATSDQFGAKSSKPEEIFQDGKDIKLWDTDAFSPLSAIFRSNRHCVLSKFVPSRSFGSELEPRIFNIDLQEIDFESDRFDIILSSDIMEHVRDDRAAHREIFRCLKPGGVYIFTVPFTEDRARTLRLVDTSSADDIFLTKPHYHGDPLTGGILAYRIYGRDLVDELLAIGFEVQFMWIDLAQEGIFSGDCFVATKPKSRQLSPQLSRPS